MSVVDGAELRERTVRDYRRWTERAGAPVDLAAIERQAVADCEVAGRVLAERPAPREAKPDPAKQAEKAGELERQVAATGSTLVTGNVRVQRRKRTALTQKAPPASKWSYAMGRLARILADDGPSPDRAAAGSLKAEIERLRAWAVMRIPKRAAHLIATRRAKDEVNPFDGVSEMDFNRMFQAKVYAICDKSTGKFGPWWVK